MAEEHRSEREPLLPWWMPLVALIAPLVWALWKTVSADGDALEEGMRALVWPGVALYLGTVAVLWAGWKIELE